MDDLGDLPRGIVEVHHTLTPFIRQRHDALHVRRVLTAHLNSHVNSGEGILAPTNLSSLESTLQVKEESGFACIQHEYLSSVRANLKARNEYASLSAQHDDHGILRVDESRPSFDTAPSVETSLDIEKQRRRHERFRIIQDLVDQLAEKPPSSSDYFNPKQLEVLNDVGSLPPVPPEVLVPAGVYHDSAKTDLKNLVDRLERSVLRAKLLLKKEQKLLEKVRANTSALNSEQGSGSRQQALGLTRNELINWMETELSKAGDSSSEPAGQDAGTVENRGKEYIESQLAFIGRIYDQYLDVRKQLVAATHDEVPPPNTAMIDEAEDFTGASADASVEEPEDVTRILTYPYLDELLSLSTEQKAIIQQRSYLTSSLTRQLKNASQDLDRLTDESHLLPSYPMPNMTQQKSHLGDPISFEEDISNQTKPSLSSRAKAWVFAAESSSIATKEAVLERLEDGEAALADAHQTLGEFQLLLGQELPRDAGPRSRPLVQSSQGNMWTTLDGNLGVIRTEDLDMD
ncbi:chromosome segregation SMC common bacterial type protein [Rutstroemia sp. NJR-2017a BBW]|nr:chromosome segregation SMC common bacterial type protein [Rutstroemia sp. NJR-2017a BBW]